LHPIALTHIQFKLAFICSIRTNSFIIFFVPLSTIQSFCIFTKMTLNEYERNPNRISVAFVTYYYNLLNSHHEKLYQLYYKDAVLKHNDYKNPFAEKAENIVGIESIKQYWDHSKLCGAKVMIQSIESSRSFEDTILIVTIGELALQNEQNICDEQPAYKFVQTFVLVPIKGKDVYDVYNDVMTFVPDIDYEYVNDDGNGAEDNKIKGNGKADSDIVKNLNKEVKVFESNGELKETSIVSDAVVKTSRTEPSIIMNNKDGENEESNSENETFKTSQINSEDSHASVTAISPDLKRQQSTEQNAKKTAEATPKKPVPVPSVPEKGLSWANQIASATKGKPTADIHPPHSGPTKSKKELSPVSKRGTTKRKDGKKHHHQGADSDDGFEKVRGGDSRKSIIQTTSVNKKGQLVYPIFLKYIDKDSSEDAIAKVLESHFGPVDSLKIDKAGAYVNFVQKDSQRRALARSTIKMNGNEVKIEAKLRKESGTIKKRKGRNGKRHGNGSQNGSSGYTEDGFKKV